MRISILFMKRLTGLILFIILLITAGAGAENLTLPGRLREIGEEAFAGNAAITEAILQEGTERIGTRAFAGCTGLRRVTLPETLEEIGEDAFTDCGEALLFLCTEGSAAAEWARSSGYDWKAGTICRALVIGNSYSGTADALQGPANDIRAMEFCLGRMNETAWNVTPRSNLSAEAIRNAIGMTFAGAGADDISLIYFSGHGAPGGELIGNDFQTITPAELRTALDAVPGRKVVIVDACYSGGMIAEESGTRGSKKGTSPSTDFAQAFMQAFCSAKRGALNTGGYYVLVACHPEEMCEEQYIQSGGSGRVMGLFTYYLSYGCGWDGAGMTGCSPAADVNRDGVVTLQEAYGYASAMANSKNPYQAAMVYPDGCTWFSPFRP